MRRALAAFFAALLAEACGGGAVRVVPQAAVANRSRRATYRVPSSEAMRWVREIALQVGPRLAGSPGDALAVAWAVQTLRAVGLDAVHTEPVRARRWVRGVERAEIVHPSRRSIVVTLLGGSAGTPPGGIESDVVEFADFQSLASAAPDSLRGRIAYVDAHMMRSRDGHGYGTAVMSRVRGASAAARAGASALLIRSVGTDGSRVAHTGALRYDDRSAHIPALAVSDPDADVLHDANARGVRLSVRIDAEAIDGGEIETFNVVGDVTGSSRPDEIVLLGAHLDSWDTGMGALDDGAGCAIIIEAARRVLTQAARPMRTIRVVLFANEENGLSGAIAYAAAHRAELGRHHVAIEADAGDGMVYVARFRGSAADRDAFRRAMRPLRRMGIAADDEDAHGGADLIPLVSENVPVVDLRQDMSTYFDYHHTPNDTPSVVRSDSLDQAVDAFARAARSLANTPMLFERAPPRTPHS